MNFKILNIAVSAISLFFALILSIIFLPELIREGWSVPVNINTTIFIIILFLVPLFIYFSRLIKNKQIGFALYGGICGFILFCCIGFFGFINCWDGSKGWGGIGCKIIEIPLSFGITYLSYNPLLALLFYILIGSIVGLFLSKRR